MLAGDDNDAFTASVLEYLADLPADASATPPASPPSASGESVVIQTASGATP